MASLTFDATTIAPATPFEVLPPGKYLAHIIESEMIPTRMGDGQYLKLTFEVLEGPYQGRKIWDQLNLVNANQQTVEIAQRMLSAICHAVGQVHVSDSEQLHFKPLIVTLKVEPAGPDKGGVHREARNKVTGYAAPNAGIGAPPAPRPARPAPRPAAPPVPPAARPGGTAPPPWRRNT
jgi:hypothetical protein